MEKKSDIPEQFEAVYEGSPWYGKSICKVLEGIDPAMAFRRLPGHVHTIAELLAHMISWKQVLVNRLEKNGKPRPRQKDTYLTAGYGSAPEAAWRNLKQTLDDQHRRLMVLLGTAIGAENSKLPWKMTRGVLQHDVYHLGQIALLKKAIRLSQYYFF
ncbi:DinB family protein [Anseongella ginsenosidimutans]|uniref:DinB family protein n=1 Tax=Anseongella ginsenosidimutans TaxID=496056 RepID=A0A4R3KUT4_9SPHI|nr:DinB family protein [Anseongella ginsenosidimutans]QEC51825.1 DinB family protein [Anseongella ginsenosidimutans]TCS89197.1 DinB family protein [Anseongella ginsenosidimutans]